MWGIYEEPDNYYFRRAKTLVIFLGTVTQVISSIRNVHHDLFYSKS